MRTPSSRGDKENRVKIGVNFNSDASAAVLDAQTIVEEQNNAGTGGETSQPPRIRKNRVFYVEIVEEITGERRYVYLSRIKIFNF
jgi:hypothetical protein